MTKKPKRGRPSLQPGGAARVTVTLDQATIDKAKRLGDGKLAPGLRLAVARCRLS